MSDLRAKVLRAMAEAERKAWDSLSRYKFEMFGYWAARWVSLNHLLEGEFSNPFADAVRLGREKVKAKGAGSEQQARLGGGAP
jgi:hypothetical protein